MINIILTGSKIWQRRMTYASVNCGRFNTLKFSVYTVNLCAPDLLYIDIHLQREMYHCLCRWRVVPGAILRSELQGCWAPREIGQQSNFFNKKQKKKKLNYLKNIILFCLGEHCGQRTQRGVREYLIWCSATRSSLSLQSITKQIERNKNKQKSLALWTSSISFKVRIV